MVQRKCWDVVDGRRYLCRCLRLKSGGTQCRAKLEVGHSGLWSVLMCLAASSRSSVLMTIIIIGHGESRKTRDEEVARLAYHSMTSHPHLNRVQLPWLSYRMGVIARLAQPSDTTFHSLIQAPHPSQCWAQTGIALIRHIQISRRFESFRCLAQIAIAWLAIPLLATHGRRVGCPIL